VSDPSGTAPERALRAPRAVTFDHAFAWYREAMRLWRVSPGMFALLAGMSMAAELSLRLLPVAGVLAAQLVIPLFECGLLYASLAADRGERPRLRHLLAVLGASPRAMTAIILSSLVAFAAQAFTAEALAGINLLQPSSLTAPLSLGALLAIVAAGLVVSLPLLFVPPIALFDDPGLSASLRQSIAAFARNPAALLVYAGLSIGLVLFGLVTNGLGLLLALPWLEASSYAAWKDVFGVPSSRER
jgi:uncharacterized membrane protein